MLQGCERALAEVDLSAIRHNVRRLRRDLAPGAVLCAVVKANGYGHGAVPVATAALEAGATWLGVAAAAEVEELRAAGLTAPVLAFGPMTGADLERAVAAGADVVVWSSAFLAAARRAGARVHVKFDSGMGRLGVPEEETRVLCARAAEDGLLAGLMSHFATADEADTAFFERQLERFSGAGRRARRRSTRTSSVTRPTARRCCAGRAPISTWYARASPCMAWRRPTTTRSRTTCGRR